MANIEDVKMHVGPHAHKAGGKEYNFIKGMALPTVDYKSTDSLYAKASATGLGAADVTVQPTFFYSPELTPDVWLLPKGRAEELRWCQIHFGLNPYIHSIINMHARYPFSNFQLKYKDAKVEKQFNDLLFKNKKFDWYDFLLQVSLSYWKYGEACLGENTEILVQNNDNTISRVTIKELYTKKVENFKVISTAYVDKTLIYTVGIADKVVLTRKNAETVKVTLTNNSSIICTPDHLFQLVNGDWRMACLLQPNDVLCSTYNNVNNFVVASVEKDKNQDVYDIHSVDKYHNFAVAPGVFVHNCIFGDWSESEGTWNYLTLLPPTEIDYREDTFSGEVSIEMIPTTVIKEKVRDALLQGRLDIHPALVDAVQNNKKIPLDTKGSEGNIFTGEMYSPPKAFVWARIQEPGEIRGTSIIKCLFKDLIFADKIRLAQMAIADRHHLPIELWTVGQLGTNADSSMLPGPEMLEDMRAMITQATQQPPFVIVAGPYLKYEALGVSGKLLSIYDDLGYVENQILVGLGVNKNIILAEGPSFCQTEDTRVLTHSGLKYYWELEPNEEIATFNPKTEEMEWQVPEAIHVFDHDGPMYHFKSAHLDHCVTPNHKIWVKPGTGNKGANKWQLIEAKDAPVKGLRFRVSTKWTGKITSDVVTCDNIDIPLEVYCKLLAYYVSEGWGIKNWIKTKYNGIGIGQSLRSDCYSDIKSVFDKLAALGVHTSYHEYDCKSYYKKSQKPKNWHKMGTWTIRTKNPELVAKIIEDGNTLSQNKQLPTWIKELPQYYLNIVLQTLLLGDGSFHKPSGLRNTDVGYNTYITTSKKLASDVAEIALKLGYRPKISNKETKTSHIYTVNFSENKYETASIEGNAGKVKKGGVRDIINYKGKVWCPEVGPHHLFISERNGKFVVTGNSSGKTIALHRLIREYTTVRKLLENFLKINIILPIARAHNITDPDGDYIIPDISWELSLTPETDKENFDIAYKMWKDGILSTETLYSKCPFALDYVLEQKRLISERGTVFDKGDKRLGKKALKQGGDAGGGLGGLLGGGGDMGGGDLGGDLGGLGDLGDLGGGGDAGGAGDLGGLLGGGAPAPGDLGGAGDPSGNLGGAPSGNDTGGLQ